MEHNIFLAFLDTPLHTKYYNIIYDDKYYYIESPSEIQHKSIHKLSR